MTQEEWDRQRDLDMNDPRLSVDRRIAAYRDSVASLHRDITRTISSQIPSTNGASDAVFSQTARLILELPGIARAPVVERLEAIEEPRFSYWWKFVHNAIIHPLLSTPLPEPRWLQRAHDWAAERCQGAG